MRTTNAPAFEECLLYVKVYFIRGTNMGMSSKLIQTDKFDINMWKSELSQFSLGKLTHNVYNVFYILKINHEQSMKNNFDLKCCYCIHYKFNSLDQIELRWYSLYLMHVQSET